MEITLAVLAEKVDAGFKGVHERQDRTNGNIINHDKEIQELKLNQEKLNGNFKALKVNWGVISLLGTVIVFLLGKYVF